MFPLVRDLAVDGISVTVTCRVLGFSTQAFYKWKKSPVTQRDWENAHLINAAYDIQADDPAFGYRFIADELPGRGIIAGENRVARLCSQQRIWSVFAKKRGLNRKSGPPVHDDLVARKFTAQKPNQLWLTDITEHWTDTGKLYLCAIKEWAVSRTQRNTADEFVQFLTRGMESVNLPGAVVELLDHCLDRVVGDVVEVSALRVVVAD